MNQFISLTMKLCIILVTIMAMVLFFKVVL